MFYFGNKMPLGKRGSQRSYAARAKRARMTFKTTRGARALFNRNLPVRFGGPMVTKRVFVLGQRINQLNRMIEPKHYTWRTSPDQGLAHNQISVVQQQSGGDLNPFRSAIAADDPMGVGGSRIGDRITVKGMMIRGFFENQYNRPKVFYRVMLIKASKGDTITRASLFQNNTDNKMIDQLNTERYTVLAQKIFTIQCGPAAPQGVVSELNGEPQATGYVRPGPGTKVFNMWIPGYKLAKNGVIQYENNSQTQVKHFDYRVVILTYDWLATDQDINNIGKINELYTKLYFKDA